MADKIELVAHDELNEITAEDPASENTTPTDPYPTFEIAQPVTHLKYEASSCVENDGPPSPD